ncbi:MAG: hypothetical protein CBE43_04835 [Rhodopirellula sp. TMED283]|nr:MAG: hypothetical protein CBE43_04835 [Rhodopirellula sp. TMED283]
MARDREVAHQRLRRQLALRPRRQVRALPLEGLRLRGPGVRPAVRERQVQLLPGALARQPPYPQLGLALQLQRIPDLDDDEGLSPGGVRRDFDGRTGVVPLERLDAVVRYF